MADVLTYLVATDLSDGSQTALRRATMLAGRSGAELVVLHVLDRDATTPVATEIEHTVRNGTAGALAELPTHARPEAEVRVMRGDPAATIGACAAQTGARLVILGAHRHRGIRDTFAGTTVERTIRSSRLPVLVANAAQCPAWRKITLATDLTPQARTAAEAAAGLGFLEGAEVTFLHAYNPAGRSVLVLAGVEREQAEREAERERWKIRRKLEGFASDCRLKEATYSVELVEGIGAPPILEAAREMHTQLLVIGTRGYVGARAVLMGSIAHDLLRDADIDILAVPPRD